MLDVEVPSESGWSTYGRAARDWMSTHAVLWRFAVYVASTSTAFRFTRSREAS